MALRPDNSLTPEEKRARAQAAQDDVLLREVDDAVRQDQYAEAAQRYGRPVGIAVIIALALFGGYLFWDHRQTAAQEKDSEALVSALDQVERGNLGSASTALDPIIKDGGDGAQAAERAGPGRDNKGWEAAAAGIEMAVLFRQLGRAPARATVRSFGFEPGGTRGNS